MKLHAVVLSVENLLRADTREFSYLTDVFHVAPQPPHSSSVQLLMKYSLTFIWCKDCVVVVVVVPLCSRRQQTNKQTNKHINKQTDRQTDGLESDSHSWGPSPCEVLRFGAAVRLPSPFTPTISSIDDGTVKLQTDRGSAISGVFQK